MKREFKLRIIAMKILLSFAALIMICTISQAQSNTEEVDLLQSIYGMEKKAAITNFLQIDNNDPFWALYDSYETERKELGKKRLDLLEKYANNYGDMADVVSDDLIAQMQTQKKSLDKLIDQYYKKIKKVSGSKVAAQFYQFENYILSVIRVEVLDGIPFIGELD